jgi:hypothetical protein
MTKVEPRKLSNTVTVDPAEAALANAKLMSTAETLEIDIFREPQFAWIAELGSTCQLPADWKVRVATY